ncbi:MAG TPA: GTP-binding protein [Chryseolinea sp.]|nr:GTP-binding protein [Chryseolinea sp.]
MLIARAIFYEYTLEKAMVLVLAGGFLGSGKTTAIVAAARLLMAQGKRIAVITNDQGDQQVDTAFVESLGFTTREVSNGCFCCNYHQLDSHLQSLQEKEQPDYIFAESVGTCTDLIATIAKPLQNFRPELKIIIVIFADADLLASILEGRSTFQEESVRYIYKKQLEEADLLVINKMDLVSDDQLKRMADVFKSEYPRKKILYQSSLRDVDVSSWLKNIEEFNAIGRDSLTIDYEVYGEGESKLAWLDKNITISTNNEDAVFVVQRTIGYIVDQIHSRHIIIGHLKFFIDTDNSSQKVSVTSTTTGRDVKLRLAPSKTVKLLINARVETDPGILEKLVDDVLLKIQSVHRCKVDHGKWSIFKPGFPRPTYRIVG